MHTLAKITFTILIGIFIPFCKIQNQESRSEKEMEQKIIIDNNTKTENETNSFHIYLTQKEISFYITTSGHGSIRQLFIQPSGLIESNDKILEEIDGLVISAELGDLNSDGFPELIIFTQSAGSGSYGNVIGYSVNNGKSLSRISFPDISENPEANSGYMGHDEFLIYESTLFQKFPVYKKGDSNINPTGGFRQIQYELTEGEASRKFVIDKILDFP